MDHEGYQGGALGLSTVLLLFSVKFSKTVAYIRETKILQFSSGYGREGGQKPEIQALEYNLCYEQFFAVS